MFVEVEFVTVAFVAIKLLVVIFVNTAVTAFKIEAKKLVEVAFVKVALFANNSPAEVLREVRLVVEMFVEVELVIVALVPVNPTNESILVQSVPRMFAFVIDVVEIVVVPRLVVAAVNELVAVTFPPVRFGAEILDTLIVPTVKLLIVDVATV
jgi:hypothetical protein